jgi:hypothetical protein
MAFVEKANTTVEDLKENFFKGAEYETQTAGTRHQEPITPIGEGVYAITRTEDREWAGSPSTDIYILQLRRTDLWLVGTTHLAYVLTIPSELGEVQEDLGLRTQGSFIISVKNPERPGPASARLPQPPDYPKEYVYTWFNELSLTYRRIISEFRGLAWSEVKPKYLDYANAQILLIGENTEHAVEATQKDKKHGKEAPKEELEALEHEDELRVKHLNGKPFSSTKKSTTNAKTGDDTIFDDLGISKKDYPQVPTTW